MNQQNKKKSSISEASLDENIKWEQPSIPQIQAPAQVQNFIKTNAVVQAEVQLSKGYLAELNGFKESLRKSPDNALKELKTLLVEAATECKRVSDIIEQQITQNSDPKKDFDPKRDFKQLKMRKDEFSIMTSKFDTLSPEQQEALRSLRDDFIAETTRIREAINKRLFQRTQFTLQEIVNPNGDIEKEFFAYYVSKIQGYENLQSDLANLANIVNNNNFNLALNYEKLTLARWINVVKQYNPVLQKAPAQLNPAPAQVQNVEMIALDFRKWLFNHTNTFIESSNDTILSMKNKHAGPPHFMVEKYNKTLKDRNFIFDKAQEQFKYLNNTHLNNTQKKALQEEYDAFTTQFKSNQDIIKERLGQTHFTLQDILSPGSDNTLKAFDAEVLRLYPLYSNLKSDLANLVKNNNLNPKTNDHRTLAQWSEACEKYKAQQPAAQLNPAPAQVQNVEMTALDFQKFKNSLVEETKRLKYISNDIEHSINEYNEYIKEFKKCFGPTDKAFKKYRTAIIAHNTTFGHLKQTFDALNDVQKERLKQEYDDFINEYSHNNNVITERLSQPSYFTLSDIVNGVPERAFTREVSIFRKYANLKSDLVNLINNNNLNPKTNDHRTLAQWSEACEKYKAQQPAALKNAIVVEKQTKSNPNLTDEQSQSYHDTLKENQDNYNYITQEFGALHHKQQQKLQQDYSPKFKSQIIENQSDAKKKKRQMILDIENKIREITQLLRNSENNADDIEELLNKDELEALLIEAKRIRKNAIMDCIATHAEELNNIKRYGEGDASDEYTAKMCEVLLSLDSRLADSTKVTGKEVAGMIKFAQDNGYYGNHNHKKHQNPDHRPILSTISAYIQMINKVIDDTHSDSRLPNGKYGNHSKNAAGRRTKSLKNNKNYLANNMEKIWNDAALEHNQKYNGAGKAVEKKQEVNRLFPQPLIDDYNYLTANHKPSVNNNQDILTHQMLEDLEEKIDSKQNSFNQYNNKTQQYHKANNKTQQYHKAVSIEEMDDEINPQQNFFQNVQQNHQGIDNENQDQEPNLLEQLVGVGKSFHKSVIEPISKSVIEPISQYMFGGGEQEPVEDAIKNDAVYDEGQSYNQFNESVYDEGQSYYHQSDKNKLNNSHDDYRLKQNIQSLINDNPLELQSQQSVVLDNLDTESNQSCVLEYADNNFSSQEKNQKQKFNSTHFLQNSKNNQSNIFYNK